MSHAISLEPTQAKSHEASIVAIAKEMETSTDIVKALYEEEFSILNVHATVKQFIGVIVTRRVKRQLRDLEIAAY